MPPYRYFGVFRFLLAALVMLHHFSAHAGPSDIRDALLPYEVGSVAVLAFFCLSGFVIVEAADLIYRQRLLAFIGNRALRIGPHFALALSAAILVTLFL